MDHRLNLIAQAPRLLVALDFDGVLSAIAPRPELARPVPGALEALQALARLSQTDAAVVSGRSLDSLRSLVGRLERVHFVGSHGAEIVIDDRWSGAHEVSPALETIVAEASSIAPESDGFVLERKPTGIAVHYRNVEPKCAHDAITRLRAMATGLGSIRLREGKCVLELSTSDADKGQAIKSLRYAVGATSVLYFGDDVTDEDAFRSLGQTDMSVKVGPGDTEADHRVNGPDEVLAVLRDLHGRRSAWLDSQRWEPIERHSVLSDQRTVALVTSTGRITWMCLPRADSGAVFSELLGGPDGGYFAVYPAQTSSTPTQAYDDATFILRTSWPELTVTDYLDCSAGRPFQRAGRTDLVRVLEGRGRAIIEFAARGDFGRAGTRKTADGRGVIVEGFPDPLVLVAPGIDWHIDDDGTHHTARAEVSLDDGPVTLELRWGTTSLKPVPLSESERRRQTAGFWRGWANSLSIPPCTERTRSLILRSALILRSLCYGPTGAIYAAATTSLPEWPGGCRNWDYRYCWPRDASLAATALTRLGNTGVGARLLEYLLRIVDTCLSPERLRPIYTVLSTELGPEAELPHLPGYRYSSPIRLGNAAAEQVQLDVFGAIVDLVYVMARAGTALTSDHWRLVEAMVTAVERRWDEPDHGVWEIRDERQHHVYSKVMCWQAVDRAIRIAEECMDIRRDAWQELRDRIRDEVVERGWCDTLGAYAASYDEPEADASALQIGLSGLLDADDPRFLATIAVVEKQLRRGPTVYRYRFNDRLPGGEGGFHLCTSWLIGAYVRAGRLDDALSLFHDLAALAGPTGTLAEQYCPIERLALGNVPQAYSHLGLINAALALIEAGVSV